MCIASEEWAGRRGKRIVSHHCSSPALDFYLFVCLFLVIVCVSGFPLLPVFLKDGSGNFSGCHGKGEGKGGGGITCRNAHIETVYVCGNILEICLDQQMYCKYNVMVQLELKSHVGVVCFGCVCGNEFMF